MRDERYPGIRYGRWEGRETVAADWYRAKPAVPFGGIYRLIDFTLTNCVNSRIYKIIVLTQYKSQSLNDTIWKRRHP